MNKKIILGFIFTSLLMLAGSSCLFAGLSVVGQNYERTSYLNSHLFLDDTHQKLIFKYDSPRQINDEKKRVEFTNLVNEFNGETKYYNYSSLFGVTNLASFEGSDEKYHFADISYLTTRSAYATNLIKLSCPENYAIAFKEEKKVYIDASQINLRKDDKITLTAYYADQLITSPLDWSIEDTTIAKIDENGNVKGIKDGETKVKVSFEETSSEVNLVVSSKTSFKTEIIKIIPVVVPESFALSKFSSIEESIGKHFLFTLDGIEYEMSIGGTYPSSTTDTLYKNKFYNQNFGDLFFFLRSPKYYLPFSSFYVTVGNNQNVNLNIHADMKVFKTFTKLKFSIPSDMDANNARISVLGSKTIYEKIQDINSLKFITFGILFITLSMFLFTIVYVFFSKNSLLRNFLFELIMIVCLIIPPLITLFVKKIHFFGLELFVSNSVIGWIYMGFSVVLAIVVTLKIINKKYFYSYKNKKTDP